LFVVEALTIITASVFMDKLMNYKAMSVQ